MISMEAKKKIVKRVITFTHTVEINEEDFVSSGDPLMDDDTAFQLAFNEVDECKAQDAEVCIKSYAADGTLVASDDE